MADPIEPQRLLERAWAIALGESPMAGQPLTTTDYRRAISSAYYALFHAITLATASILTPDGVSRHELVRSFGHGDLKRVTGWVHSGKSPEGLERSVGALREDPRVRMLSAAFQHLVTARETADYDHNASFRRSDVYDVAVLAQRAVDLVEDPAFAASAEGRRFLGLMALRARGGGA